ncbi:MAG TPA: DUF6250 domain-containing protein [Chthoniobacteraceae bacterium]|nr:DUF6250 domain-containing protein [Chthoniobacteraceae bacterium]
MSIEKIAMKSRCIFEEHFHDERWRDRWWVESQGAVVGRTEAGITISNPQSGTSGGTTIWLRRRLPENVIVRVGARTHAPVEGNACNLNVVLHALEPDGAPVRPGRSGDYPELHVIPNLIVTFTGGSAPGWSRIRRNPGFRLVSEAACRAEPNRQYELDYVLNQGQIAVWINGECRHCWRDAQPLNGGYFGLRTWCSNVSFTAVRIGVPDGTSPLDPMLPEHEITPERTVAMMDDQSLTTLVSPEFSCKKDIASWAASS